MKTLPILTLLSLVLGLIASAASATAATIHLQDRVIGWAGTNGRSNYTMHYYFITAMSGGMVDASLCLGTDPPGNGTSLDIHFYLPPNPLDDGSMFPFAGVRLERSAPCDTNRFFLPVGNYIIATRVGNGDWDGGENQGIVSTFTGGSRFNYFDYTASFAGDIKLTEIRLGQRDGSFNITLVPEPTTLTAAGLSAIALTLRRRRRVRCAHRLRLPGAVAACLLALILGGAETQAEQGVLRWTSQQGMGYQLQRSTSLGRDSAWIPIPSVSYYGTGGPLWHHCFDLQPPTSNPTGTAALNQIVPV